MFRRRITIFFCVLGLVTLFSLWIPFRPEQSDLEKRVLAKFPEISPEAVWDGSFFRAFDNWYSDTFPMRDYFLKGNAWIEGFYGMRSEQVIGAVGQADEIPQVAAAQKDDSDDQIEEEEKQGETNTEESMSEEESASEIESGEEENNQSGETVPSDSEEETLEESRDGTIHAAEEVADYIYLADDRAFDLFYFNRSAADTYIASVNALAKWAPSGTKVYDILVPTSAGIYLAEDMRKSLNSSDQDEAIQYVYHSLGKKVKTVDIFEKEREHMEEYIYFRTDHHWTALGAYYAYEEFAKAKGIKAQSLEKYETKEFPDFLGSFYASSRQAKQLKENMDTVIAYVPRSTNLMTFVDQNGDEMKWYVIFDVSDYSKGAKYSCFIGGDNPLAQIDNPKKKDGSSCLVIKESFGNAFVPFLVDHYQHVYVVDYRYYTGNLKQLVQKKAIKDILLINNTEAMCSEGLTQTLKHVIQ